MAKRHLAAAENVEGPYIQQPVSCRFCRSRKLKCDRKRPSCFNCSSRDRECVYHSDQRDSPSVPSPAVRGDNPINEDNLSLVQRIKRLEQAVFGKSSTAHVGRPADAAPGDNHSHDDHRPTASGLARHDEEQQRTSQWLEGLLATDAAASPAASSPARAADLSAILRAFPTEKDASALLHRYIKTVDATYRLLHRPTAWRQLRALFGDLDAGRTPSATQLAFFLYIFAGSAHVVAQRALVLETPALRDCAQVTLAERWARQAIQLATEPPVPPSVEALQTLLGLAHLCAQIMGMGGSFGTLGMQCLRMAYAMNIHRLDSQMSREERRRDGADMVSVEVKRRIWWHMTASNWLLSFVGGPNEGTYLIHPHQMETLQPSNVEDMDIPVGITHFPEDAYCLPRSQPTSMSYVLERIEFAKLVRQVVDTLPLSYFAVAGKDTSDDVYDKVMHLDGLYQDHIRSLPPFFQLATQGNDGHTDHANVMTASASYQQALAERPYLEWQCYLTNLILHTQLARLHQPFLIRGARDAKYAHSRLQCLRSAETVVDIGKRTVADNSTGWFIYVLQHFLTASIVLAMDVCFNPEGDQAPRRKQKVLRACQDLEAELNARVVPASSASSSEDDDLSSAKLVIQSFQNTVRQLRATLRKHAHEEEVADGSGTPALPATARGMQMTPAIRTHVPTSLADQGDPDTSMGDEGLDEPLLMDGLWNDFFAMGSNFSETDWDAFFSDVGASQT